MTTGPYRFIFSLLVFLARAPEPAHSLERPFLESVVLMRRKNSSVCGTGFLTSHGEIVTASHLFHSLCPEGTCRDLELTRSSEEGAPPTTVIPTGPLSPSMDLRGLDATVLVDPSSTLPKGSFLPSAPAIQGGEVLSVGFPHCERLAVNTGSIETVDSLRMVTTTRGAPGSSGSPLISPSGQLLGLVDQASHLSDAIAYRLTGIPFKNRGVRMDLIEQLKSKDPVESLITEAQVLLYYHDATIRPVERTYRLLLAMEYFALVEGFATRLELLATPQEAHRRMLKLVHYPSLLPSPPNDTLSEVTEQLAWTTALENKGAYNSLFQAIDRDTLEKNLRSSGRSPAQQTALLRSLDSIISGYYRGSELMWITTVAWWLAVIVPIALLWAWTLGYVWATCPGRTAKKLFMSFLVGFLMWPLPFFSYLKKLKRDREKEMKRKKN